MENGVFHCLAFSGIEENFVNPSSNSDQHKISPCNINPKFIREIMRIKDVMNPDISTTSPGYSYNNCMITYLKYL